MLDKLGGRTAITAVVAACALSACGDKQPSAEQGQATPQPAGAPTHGATGGGIFGGGQKIEPAKATVELDVVGVKPGLSASAIKKQLETDGWRMTGSNGTVIRAPGVDDYELPSNQTWFRSVNDGEIWRSEQMQVAYTTALPREEALAYRLQFNRQQQDQQANSPNSGSSRQITAQYTVDTFGALKGKYGEPTSMQEGSCSSYNGSTSEVIPTYRLTYARGADNPAALSAQIGRDCRQSLSIEIQDQALLNQQNQRMSAFRSAQYQKESNKAGGKKADF